VIDIPVVRKYLQYVDKWNTLVPELPCGELPGFVVRQVEKAIQDPEFAAVFEEVVGKCALIVQNRPDVDVSLKWLCLSSQGIPNWQGVYMGKMDWATKPKSSGAPMSASDQAYEAALKAEREAELRGEK
jgi:hypothetical protein